ncbi:hypothetical protein [Microbacterium aurugineum]|uniref:hypothetical protein n=1 Tax=Microbacterium aurugineum TaxID=2851642 RepID=UPI0020BE33E6|nr:hypothetical protein [Microbacterium aurugineum]MCK8476088.1 hypothetical protein [Microbacterium aurugineum]
MGMFQQKPEEEQSPWALPSEPVKRSEAEVLGEEPAVDPLSLGLGFGATTEVSSIVFPIAEPAAEPVGDYEAEEPVDDAGAESD